MGWVRGQDSKGKETESRPPKQGTSLYPRSSTSYQGVAAGCVQGLGTQDPPQL